MDVDFVVKGLSNDVAVQIFYDIVLKYAFYLETIQNVNVLGFYHEMVRLVLPDLLSCIGSNP